MNWCYVVILLTKLKLTVSIDADLVKWIDGQIKDKKFASRSHGFEYAVSQLKKSYN
ncbi:MAG: ribbon-helix-helix domain-containing protein [Candidatus Nitrosotalea sp.]|nr:ribbon-helix-helix domain-containing protein [Candidatus Nitrosotalea sp.]